jgi:hypothetical protein
MRRWYLKSRATRPSPLLQSRCKHTYRACHIHARRDAGNQCRSTPIATTTIDRHAEFGGLGRLSLKLRTPRSDFLLQRLSANVSRREVVRASDRLHYRTYSSFSRQNQNWVPFRFFLLLQSSCTLFSQPADIFFFFYHGDPQRTRPLGGHHRRPRLDAVRPCKGERIRDPGHQLHEVRVLVGNKSICVEAVVVVVAWSGRPARRCGSFGLVGFGDRLIILRPFFGLEFNLLLLTSSDVATLTHFRLVESYILFNLVALCFPQLLDVQRRAGGRQEEQVPRHHPGEQRGWSLLCWQVGQDPVRRGRERRPRHARPVRRQVLRHPRHPSLGSLRQEGTYKYGLLG